MSEVEVKEKIKRVRKTEVLDNSSSKSVVPKIFMKKDERIKVEVTCFFSKETGDMILVLPKEMATNDKENIDNVLLREDFEFIFSKVTYDKLNIYRSRSMIYNSEDKNNTINAVKLRNFLLIFHLQDWNIKDENGNKIELKFDPNGALTNETLNLIYTLPSNLLDLVLATYEKRMNIF